MRNKGYIQIYTGNGKGKTTAAIGLAVRAAGAGLKVFIGQFAKGSKCSEHKALAKFAKNIRLKQYGGKCFIGRKHDAKDLAMARRGFEEIKRMVASGRYPLVILDEITTANKYGFVTVDEVLMLIKSKPQHVELVLTGRNADSELIKSADLVTEMKEVKHYFKRGVQARVGIEK
ncbi:MAG TPA: cob(I)yrinic acid a,c-diamide adenosyltransferase [Lentisphaeria bacterium]|nr:MAG: cob(I)yrinic acid a,c-diamide adenosyltransferase [Lentisphaerae bacterium GWF2_49_21]HBC87562.1 cob(I)yrinic acid a,c-diamide adenosyltransferase [Lentisphaeria bacterium]